MTGRQHRTGRMRHGWRAAIGIALAVAILVPVSAAVAAAHSTPAAARTAAAVSPVRQAAGSLSGRSGAPAGWAPVPFRNAQLLVPGSWLVESPGQELCGFSESGIIFAGARPEIPNGLGCSLPASVAWIVPAGHIRPGIRHRRPTAVINGIPVYRLRSGKGSVLYLVPELGVRVGARGPKARRVLATLTRSPLWAVLRPGAASVVPASWTWRRVAGIRFATPRSWELLRAHQWATCGTGLVPGSLSLIDATKPPLYLPCPFQVPTATAEQAQPGLTVVTGKYAARSVGQSYVRCQVRHGSRICLSAATGQGGILGGVLIFSVSPPHRRAVAYFLLGLSGSGGGARAIFDSIRLVATH